MRLRREEREREVEARNQSTTDPSPRRRSSLHIISMSPDHTDHSHMHVSVEVIQEEDMVVPTGSISHWPVPRKSVHIETNDGHHVANTHDNTYAHTRMSFSPGSLSSINHNNKRRASYGGENKGAASSSMFSFKMIGKNKVAPLQQHMQPEGDAAESSTGENSTDKTVVRTRKRSVSAGESSSRLKPQQSESGDIVAEHVM